MKVPKGSYDDKTIAVCHGGKGLPAGSYSLLLGEPLTASWAAALALG